MLLVKSSLDTCGNVVLRTAVARSAYKQCLGVSDVKHNEQTYTRTY